MFSHVPYREVTFWVGMPDFQTHPNSQIVIYIEHPSRYDYFTPKFWATGSRDETWTDRWTPGPFPAE